jgi:hypothetical protein
MRSGTAPCNPRRSGVCRDRHRCVRRAACQGARRRPRCDLPLRVDLPKTPIPPCEAILAVGEPLTYHRKGADADLRLANFFRAAAQTLPQGGILIFDVIEAGGPSLSGRSWMSDEDWAVLAECSEDPATRILTRDIQTFRRVGMLYRRCREIHRVRLFETAALLEQLAECGFSTGVANTYGTEPLAPRRRAFFCTRE